MIHAFTVESGEVKGKYKGIDFGHSSNDKRRDHKDR